MAGNGERSKLSWMIIAAGVILLAVTIGGALLDR
jgi:hypothetical protein